MAHWLGSHAGLEVEVSSCISTIGGSCETRGSLDIIIRPYVPIDEVYAQKLISASGLAADTLATSYVMRSGVLGDRHGAASSLLRVELAYAPSDRDCALVGQIALDESVALLVPNNVTGVPGTHI